MCKRFGYNDFKMGHARKVPGNCAGIGISDVSLQKCGNVRLRGVNGIVVPIKS